MSPLIDVKNLSGYRKRLLVNLLCQHVDMGEDILCSNGVDDEYLFTKHAPDSFTIECITSRGKKSFDRYCITKEFLDALWSSFDVRIITIENPIPNKWRSQDFEKDDNGKTVIRVIDEYRAHKRARKSYDHQHIVYDILTPERMVIMRRPTTTKFGVSEYFFDLLKTRQPLLRKYRWDNKVVPQEVFCQQILSYLSTCLYNVLLSDLLRIVVTFY
jgi:hypothetical protein